MIVYNVNLLRMGSAPFPPSLASLLSARGTIAVPAAAWYC